MLVDLDDTALPEGGVPTARVMEAVKAAAQIIPVGVASGRVQDDVGHFARLFGLTGPQVSDNGATLLDPVSGRSILSHTLERADAERAVKELRPVAMRVIACDAGRFVRNADDITDWSVTMVIGQFATEAETKEWADRLQSDSINAIVSVDNKGDWYLDCTSGGVDKGRGARDFASQVGVDVADLMVIGDGWNDVPMFEVAGIAVAMGGAPAELRELAVEVVAGVEDDGAAEAIEKYVLGQD